MLEKANPRWKFNLSPLFVEFLRGQWDLQCTPWGMPTYNLFGWQKPCYLIQEGHVATFRELMELTNWDNYGTASGNPKCTDCMVHSGYEASAVAETFGSLAGLLRAARVTLRGLKPLGPDPNDGDGGGTAGPIAVAANGPGCRTVPTGSLVELKI